MMVKNIETPLEAALRLYKSKELGLYRAAKAAGMTTEAFMDTLGSLGVPLIDLAEVELDHEFRDLGDEGEGRVSFRWPWHELGATVVFQAHNHGDYPDKDAETLHYGYHCLAESADQHVCSGCGRVAQSVSIMPAEEAITLLRDRGDIAIWTQANIEQEFARLSTLYATGSICLCDDCVAYLWTPGEAERLHLLAHKHSRMGLEEFERRCKRAHRASLRGANLERSEKVLVVLMDVFFLNHPEYK